MSDCVFCRIIAGAIPSKPLFEDEDCIAIHDISPMAPLHILIIPKAHIASLDELEDGEIAAACLNACKKAAAMLREMCCLFAYQNNIKVFTRGGTYLNKRFKEIAEAHGLTVEQSKKHGYAETKLTSEARKVIEPLVSGLQALKRVENAKGGGDKRPSSTRKYKCLRCRQNVRATKQVNIICGICNDRMVEVR